MPCLPAGMLRLWGGMLRSPAGARVPGPRLASLAGWPRARPPVSSYPSISCSRLHCSGVSLRPWRTYASNDP